MLVPPVCGIFLIVSVGTPKRQMANHSPAYLGLLAEFIKIIKSKEKHNISRTLCISVFAWIPIRFSNFSGSGSRSGFSPDSGTKKECRNVSKSNLSRKLKNYD